MFDFDDDFGLDDLIEADIEFGFFEDDVPLKERQKQKSIREQTKNLPKQRKKQNLFGIYSNFNYLYVPTFLPYWSYSVILPEESFLKVPVFLPYWLYFVVTPFEFVL